MLFAQYLRDLWWPFWDVWHNLCYYLDAVTAIREGLIYSRDLMKLGAKRAKLVQISIIQLVLTIRCAHLIAISFIDFPLFWKVIQHDYMLFLNSPKEINLLPMLFGFQAITFNYLMFHFNYRRHFEPILLVRRILFKGWNGCFRQKRIYFLGELTFASEVILFYTRNYLNFLKYFYGIIGKNY